MADQKKKKKIVIASEDEVAQYGGDTSQRQEAAPGSEDQNADQSAAENAPEASEAGALSPEVNAPEENEPSEAQQWKEKFLRAQAELVNFQRRAAREREESVRYAVSPLVRLLLPVLDDLERVIAAGREHPDNAQTMLDGAQMTLEKFHKALQEAHVVPIKAEGEVFDPQVHEAMMERPAGEHSERIVLEEVQKGYALHDRVLRPAKVIVSKPTAHAGESPAEEQEQ
jgi:molecular chaperone GrpE